LDQLQNEFDTYKKEMIQKVKSLEAQISGMNAAPSFASITQTMQENREVEVPSASSSMESYTSSNSTSLGIQI
jgi:hypothetical protein